jgi:anthranilate synthase/aminodeoxychorismate synthase-like glutamine amidotransferase
MTPRVLLIDNYDSFTYNLVQAFLTLGAQVEVRRNDAITVEEARVMEPTHLCISPGPGSPAEAGISIPMIKAFAGNLPILGVCLGHQALIEACDGRVTRASRLMHGKASSVSHDRRGLFEELPSPLDAGRYHSLIAERASLPGEFQVTAWTAEEEVMGVRHRSLRMEGVQFHPESVLTPLGPRMLANFLMPGLST